MRIECILKREGGSSVELDGQAYLFAPQPDGRHIAEVKNPSHVKRLLGIAEAYQPAELTDADDDEGDGDDDPVLIEKDTQQGAQATGAMPEPVKTGDQGAQAAAEVPAAEVGPHLDTPQPATPPTEPAVEQNPAETIKAAIATAPAPDAGETANSYEAMTDAEVNAEFEKAFGRAPNSKAKRATIIQKLIEKAAQG